MSKYSEMFCSGQEEMVHRYLDGELSTTEQTEFSLHLTSCESCQELLTEVQQLFVDLDSLEDSPVPDIVSDVMDQLSPAPVTPRYTLLGGLLLVGQAMIGLILLLFAQSMFQVTIGNEVVGQFWLTVNEIGFSLSDWLAEIVVELEQLGQTQWPPQFDIPGFDAFSLVGLLTLGGLSLVWLFGNLLLLRPSQQHRNMEV